MLTSIAGAIVGAIAGDVTAGGAIAIKAIPSITHLFLTIGGRFRRPSFFFARVRKSEKRVRLGFCNELLSSREAFPPTEKPTPPQENGYTKKSGRKVL